MRSGTCHAIYWYVKANNEYLKNNEKKKKESSYIKYKDVNNLYRWSMSQRLPVNDFKWVDEPSQFQEDFIKSYN